MPQTNDLNKKEARKDICRPLRIILSNLAIKKHLYSNFNV